MMPEVVPRTSEEIAEYRAQMRQREQQEQHSERVKRRQAAQEDGWRSRLALYRPAKRGRPPTRLEPHIAYLIVQGLDNGLSMRELCSMVPEVAPRTVYAMRADGRLAHAAQKFLDEWGGTPPEWAKLTTAQAA